MSSRTVLIPASSVGTLDACRIIFRDIAKLTHAPAVDVEALMAATVLQAGVDRFLVYSKLGREIGRTSFVRGRIETLDPSGLDALYRTVSDAVRSQFVRKPPEKSRISPSALAGDIVDLVIASRYRTSLMLGMPFIEISEYRQFLRPAFFAALESFLGTVEVEASAVPLPRRIAKASAVKRFHTLIESDLFCSYSAAHRQLQLPQSDFQVQAKRVSSAARKLTFGYSDSVSLQTLALSGLAVTSDLIDAFLGKLPAAAIKPFRDLFEAYFISDHRVVIYDFHSVWWKSFHEQIVPLVEAVRNNSDKRKKA